MPLLRLLLQISNMYQNVKETQSELREQRPPADRPPTASNSNHHYNPLGNLLFIVFIVASYGYLTISHFGSNFNW